MPIFIPDYRQFFLYGLIILTLFNIFLYKICNIRRIFTYNIIKKQTKTDVKHIKS